MPQMKEVMELLELEVQKREATGKGCARKLRAVGLIPGVVYGLDKPPLLIKLVEKELAGVFKTKSGENSLLNLKFPGEAASGETTMIQEVQREILKPNLLHVDFIRISLEETTTVLVPLYLEGEPKEKGGLLEQNLREVEVECLPLDIPQNIVVDLSELTLGSTITVANLKLVDKVKILADPSESIIVYNEIAEEEVVTEDETDLLFATEKSEPEVIGRKSEEEEE